MDLLGRLNFDALLNFLLVAIEAVGSDVHRTAPRLLVELEGNSLALLACNSCSLTKRFVWHGRTCQPAAALNDRRHKRSLVQAFDMARAAQVVKHDDLVFEQLLLVLETLLCLLVVSVVLGSRRQAVLGRSSYRRVVRVTALHRIC